MTSDCAHAAKLLEDSRAEFLDLIRDLTDAQWTYKPAPGCWSIGETAEHVVLAETGLFSKMKEALANPPGLSTADNIAGKEDFLERVLPDRKIRTTAPEPLRPHRSWGREETVARFLEARARTLQFAEETNLPLKSHTTEHPFPVFNTLTAYEWLLYIPLHHRRHLQQIAEIKASVDFPKVEQGPASRS